MFYRNKITGFVWDIIDSSVADRLMKSGDFELAAEYNSLPLVGKSKKTRAKKSVDNDTVCKPIKEQVQNG